MSFENLATQDLLLLAGGGFLVVLGVVLFLARGRRRPPSEEPAPLTSAPSADEPDRGERPEPHAETPAARSPQPPTPGGGAPSLSTAESRPADTAPTAAAGSSLPADVDRPSSPEQAPPPLLAGLDSAPKSRLRQPAGFFHRAAAFILDGLVLTLAWNACVKAMAGGSGFGGIGAMKDEQLVSLFMALWALQWAYKSGMESSPLQATLGKLACGLRVVDLLGGRASFARTSGRMWASLFGALAGGFVVGFVEGATGGTSAPPTWALVLGGCWGYLLALFGSRRQALHDRLSGTLVVKL